MTYSKEAQDIALRKESGIVAIDSILFFPC